MLSKAKTQWAIEQMGEMFPNAKGELVSHSTFQMLIAIMLSAQTTDIGVNKVTPKLFNDFPTPEAFATADLQDIMDDIRTIGLYKTKAKHVKETCQLLVDDYQSQVPNTRADLMRLPGVGRKTVNVLLGDAFHIPAIAVDTHVDRVSKRLGIVKKSASVLEVEEALMKKLPAEIWVKAHHRIIFFGRYHCLARSPKCDICPLLEICPEGLKRMGFKK